MSNMSFSGLCGGGGRDSLREQLLLNQEMEVLNFLRQRKTEEAIVLLKSVNQLVKNLYAADSSHPQQLYLLTREPPSNCFMAITSVSWPAAGSCLFSARS